MTEGIGFKRGQGSHGMQLVFIDVRRAYFYADSKRTVYVDLPPEDHEEGMCGKLVKSMYGTRDAAQNWELEYSTCMRDLGFNRGQASPCVFYHQERNIRTASHGDDFTLLGYEKDLDWFRDQIASRYSVKFRGRLGPRRGSDRSVRILNRSIQWEDDAITYEADQRHAELIVKHLGLSDKTNSVVTPGVKRTNGEDDEDDGGTQ